MIRFLPHKHKYEWLYTTNGIKTNLMECSKCGKIKVVRENERD